MLTYQVTPAIELREPLPQSDAPALLALLTANRAQYQYYLPWVAKIQTVADEQRFLTLAQAQLQQAQALNLVIVVEQRIAGMVGTVTTSMIVTTVPTSVTGWGDRFRGMAS